MAGHGSPPPEDRAHHPNRKVARNDQNDPSGLARMYEDIPAQTWEGIKAAARQGRAQRGISYKPGGS